MANEPTPADDTEFGLIVVQAGELQQKLSRLLVLTLNYRYGLDLMAADTFVEAFSLVQKYKHRVRCTAIIQDRKIDTKTSLVAMSRDGEVPLLLILPEHLIESHREMCHRMQNVYYCPWEMARSHTADSLQSQIEKAFGEHGIGEIFDNDASSLTHEQMQERVERRLRNVKTLPTLPAVALRIMAMMEDPRPTARDLEEVLMSDPAIVHKLLQVINSPIFAGGGQKGGWTLQQAIVRLGRRKVGAVAQQVKMMNAIVRPEESLFDLRRFWEHSVGCALICDRLYRDKLIQLDEELEFNTYWIGALLHDCGKLALGFFFWDHFEEILKQMGNAECTFREAEQEICEDANHEFLGQILLLRSNVGAPLVRAVASHHAIGAVPGALGCLIHVASNLCKDIGKGYLQDEPVVYSAEVLKALGLEKENIRELREAIGEEMVSSIDDFVDRCTQPA